MFFINPNVSVVLKLKNMKIMKLLDIIKYSKISEIKHSIKIRGKSVLNNISNSCIAEIEHHSAFKSLFENALEGILIIQNGKFVLCNQTIVQMLGYHSKEKLLNLHPSKLSPEFQPDGRTSYEKAEEMMQLAIKNDRHHFEWVHTRANGEDFWAEITLTSIIFNDCNVIHVVWKDISQKMKTIEALKESELKNQHLTERMELALLGNKDGLWDWNTLDDSIYFSSRWKEILGYSNDEIENEFINWEKNVHYEDLAEVMVEVNKNLNKKTEYFESTYRMKHKKGHWVWILDRGKTFFDQEDQPYRMIGTHTDVTADKERQLKYHHQAQIIEQIHDSVISTDLEGFIRSWNAGAERLFEYKADEMIGKHITTLYFEEDHKALQGSIKILKERGLYQSEVRMVKKSKKIIFAELTLSLLKDEKGLPIGMIGYSKDVTYRKEIEKKLDNQKDILLHQAQHDYLTDLPNRILFNNRLEEGIEKASRNQTKLALLFIDLDYFKLINDTYGHDIGDKVLKAVSKEFKSVIRKVDTLARLGGDEFIIILEDLKEEEDASLFAQKILEISKHPIKIDNLSLSIAASIGISIYPTDTSSIIKLYQYADLAMYKAKEEGRNNFQFFEAEL